MTFEQWRDRYWSRAKEEDQGRSGRAWAAARADLLWEIEHKPAQAKWFEPARTYGVKKTEVVSEKLQELSFTLDQLRLILENIPPEEVLYLAVMTELDNRARRALRNKMNEN